ncbi:MAG: four helix bundle protein [Gammaproteobacteria bacterium]
MDVFEKLEVWKRSCRLCVELYRSLHSCRDRGFKDQLTRAALSVPSNIAEGYERGSRKEYLRFLRIAKGSCGEVRTQLYIGSEVGLLHSDEATRFIREARELTMMLQGLIRALSAPQRHTTEYP